MKRTFFITALAFLLIGLLTGCNSMKKLQKEAIETAVIGQINPTQLQAVNGKLILSILSNSVRSNSGSG